MQPNQFTSGVPRQVLDQFIKKLEDEKISTEIISRLKKIILEEGNISEVAIKNALFSSDTNT